MCNDQNDDGYITPPNQMIPTALSPPDSAEPPSTPPSVSSISSSDEIAHQLLKGAMRMGLGFERQSTPTPHSSTPPSGSSVEPKHALIGPPAPKPSLRSVIKPLLEAIDALNSIQSLPTPGELEQFTLAMNKLGHAIFDKYNSWSYGIHVQEQSSSDPWDGGYKEDVDVWRCDKGSRGLDYTDVVLKGSDEVMGSASWIGNVTYQLEQSCKELETVVVEVEHEQLKDLLGWFNNLRIALNRQCKEWGAEMK